MNTTQKHKTGKRKKSTISPPYGTQPEHSYGNRSPATTGNGERRLFSIISFQLLENDISHCVLAVMRQRQVRGLSRSRVSSSATLARQHMHSHTTHHNVMVLELFLRIVVHEQCGWCQGARRNDFYVGKLQPVSSEGFVHCLFRCPPAYRHQHRPRRHCSRHSPPIHAWTTSLIHAKLMHPEGGRAGGWDHVPGRDKPHRGIERVRLQQVLRACTLVRVAHAPQKPLTMSLQRLCYTRGVTYVHTNPKDTPGHVPATGIGSWARRASSTQLQHGCTSARTNPDHALPKHFRVCVATLQTCERRFWSVCAHPGPNCTCTATCGVQHDCIVQGAAAL